MAGILQLGRYGDLLNVLPLAKHLSDQGERPTLIIAEAFRDIGDSIDYADTRVFPGDSLESKRALAWATPQFKRLLFSQVYRPGCKGPGVRGRTYCEESYNFAGYGDFFRSGGADSIVISRRNSSREETLASEAAIKPGRLNILVNLGGHSSPFQFSREIFKMIHQRCRALRSANLIDLSKIRAEKFTDLLGLYGRSNLLITTDTSTLHLAGASLIPYVALIADRPTRWHGSYTRHNCVLRARYSDALTAAPLIDQMIQSASGAHRRGPKLRHVYYSFDSRRPDTRRRNQMAEQTWRTAYRQANWVPKGLSDNDLARRFDDGGHRQLTYLKELLNRAVENSAPEDYVVLTNSDTSFSPALSANLVAVARRRQMLVGMRRDFDSLDEQLVSVRQVRGGRAYCGTDLFFFPVSWWLEVRSQFPDMLLGAEAWDYVMRELLVKYGAHLTNDLIYHEWHPSFWEQAENRYTLPSQIHNIKAAVKACRELGLKACPSFKNKL